MFKPGAIWNDTDGKPIQAHGGGILFDAGMYYWFGENKDGPTLQREGFYERVDVIGVSCYSSRDLQCWHNEGLVLKAVADDPTHDLHPSKVLERPKVIRDPRSGRYVMYLHIDTADYTYARVGVAVADRPSGPYEYQGSFAPDGADSRDMTIFQDSKGRGHLVFSSNWNATLKIYPLEDDLLRVGAQGSQNFVGQSREAPALFEHQGRYFMVTSGCTGWDPNVAEYAVARSVLGPWDTRGNPCQGLEAELTYRAQSTFVLPVAGQKGAFILMLDRWNRYDLRDSRYVWLPLTVEGEAVSVHWHDTWDLSVFDQIPSPV